MARELRSLVLVGLAAALAACGSSRGGGLSDGSAGDVSSSPDVIDLPEAGAGDRAWVDAALGDASGIDGGDDDRDPVILVHGINGSSADYATMHARLLADGWPADRVFLIDFPDPKWGCNTDNAALLATFIQQVLVDTGRSRVDIVAHSMGGLSARYYIKNLGGQDVVNTFATMGTMHHGLSTPCLSPIKPCVWDEICSSGAFIAQLNAPPATPGQLTWVSMYGESDTTVPNSSSHLDGAENIGFPGVTHDGASGLPESPEVYTEVKRVLAYPAW